MKVITRSGQKEPVKFDLITNKIERLASECKDYTTLGIPWKKLNVDPVFIAQKICSLIYDGITTTQLDDFSASFAATLFKNEPDYLILASRIAINNHHKNNKVTFNKLCNKLYETGILSEEFINYVNEEDNCNFFEESIFEQRDYNISYFGFKSLEKSYLLKTKDGYQETPQHLFMRVAIAIHMGNNDMIKKVYDSLSEKYYTHATPTLFNAGTNYQQLSSCFLLGTEDSVEGLYKTAADMAKISKWAGGIGVHISNVRAKDSHINKTGGKSNGIMPLLKVYNDISRHINQSGKRNGSFAVYIEPWHADIYDFLDAKKNNGVEEMRARDLFYALWIPDLFMKRVETDGMWSLMCPNECKGLNDVHSEEFEKLYIKYETNKLYRKQIKAKELWERIINTQIETGLPYILYKDAVNRKSNQKNYGIIKSSNLCTEIVEYSDSNETAVCNLASICLPKYVTDKETDIDYTLLYEKTKEIVINLNSIINVNSYPTSESKMSNMRHRPIGIGVQGLADLFMILKIPYDSDEARAINRKIFECIYYASLEQSMELSKKFGPYETFKGSPASQGILQFDMWETFSSPSLYTKEIWDELKENIKTHGIRNSLLVAPMPTASTAQIMGNNESFEPYTSNLYTRAVLSGNYVIVNNHLINELKNRKLFSNELIEKIMLNKGSVQNLDLPNDIEQVYKTSWELSQKSIIQLAIDRGPFICQSQSLNLFVNPPTPKIIHSIHFYGWKNGLKTGSYYIRSKSILDNQNFSTDVKKESNSNSNSNSNSKFSECLSCSS
jgi:ribonucleoside-diphosphate reductase alpha chain